MTNYLKKKKMHKLAKMLCADVPALYYCNYQFYRGSEWLKFTPLGVDDDDIYCKLYVCCSYLHFVRLVYDYESDSYRTIARNFINGQKFKNLISSL